MVKRHYLTGVVVLLSMIAGIVVASAAEIGTKTPDYAVQAVAYRHNPQPPFYGSRGYYDYAAPPAVYGNPSWYGYQWDPYTWSTGNGYY
jgi:hypothetical protein